jgi:DNA primase
VGVDLTIISLPGDAKDPDELIQQDVALWQQAIDTAQPAVDWILDQYQKREDLTTASGKRAFTTAGLNVVRMLKDPVEQDHYEQKIAAMIGSSVEAVKAKLAAVPKEAEVERKTVKAQQEMTRDEFAYQDNVLAAALIDTGSQELLHDFDASMFAGEQRQAVAKYLSGYAGGVITNTPKDLQNYDTYVKILLLKADARYAAWSDQDRSLETARLLRQVTTEHKQHQKDQLTTELRDAEAAGDDAKAAEVRTKLNTLIKETTRARR